MLRTIVLHLQRIRYNIYVNEFRSRLTEFIDDERVGFVNIYLKHFNRKECALTS